MLKKVFASCLSRMLQLSGTQYVSHGGKNDKAEATDSLVPDDDDLPTITANEWKPIE